MPFLKPLGTQLLLLTLSACLALPALAVSAYILHVYRTQHASNPWWLPVWRAHFDISGLLSVISASCLIFALDITSIGIIFGCKSTGLKVSFLTLLVLCEYRCIDEKAEQDHGVFDGWAVRGFDRRGVGRGYYAGGGEFEESQ